MNITVMIFKKIKENLFLKFSIFWISHTFTLLCFQFSHSCLTFIAYHIPHASTVLTWIVLKMAPVTLSPCFNADIHCTVTSPKNCSPFDIHKVRRMVRILSNTCIDVLVGCISDEKFLEHFICISGPVFRRIWAVESIRRSYRALLGCPDSYDGNECHCES